MAWEEPPEKGNPLVLVLRDLLKGAGYVLDTPRRLTWQALLGREHAHTGNKLLDLLLETTGDPMNLAGLGLLAKAGKMSKVRKAAETLNRQNVLEANWHNLLRERQWADELRRGAELARRAPATPAAHPFAGTPEEALEQIEYYLWPGRAKPAPAKHLTEALRPLGTHVYRYDFNEILPEWGGFVLPQRPEYAFVSWDPQHPAEAAKTLLHEVAHSAYYLAPEFARHAQEFAAKALPEANQAFYATTKAAPGPFDIEEAIATLYGHAAQGPRGSQMVRQLARGDYPGLQQNLEAGLRTAWPSLEEQAARALAEEYLTAIRGGRVSPSRALVPVPPPPPPQPMPMERYVRPIVSPLPPEGRPLDQILDLLRGYNLARAPATFSS